MEEDVRVVIDLGEGCMLLIDKSIWEARKAALYKKMMDELSDPVNWQADSEGVQLIVVQS